MQVLYLGKAPRTKVTLPDFREKCRVTRHSRVFLELMGSQRTPGKWGVTMHYALCTMHYSYVFIRIHMYLLFYTYSYVFIISRENPTKSRDFGTHA